MKKTNLLFVWFASLLTILLMSFDVSFAAESDVPDKIFTTFTNIVQELIKYYIMFAWLIWTVFMLIHWISMLWKSDQRGKEEAKEKFMTTVKTGILVILLPALITFMLGLVVNNISNDDVFDGTELNNTINKLSWND